MSHEFLISEDEAGVSPKSFLKKRIDLPFHTIQKLIKEKRITLNKKKIKQESRLEVGDIVKIWPENVPLRNREVSLIEKNLELEIIFENDDFMVLDKKAGIIVQGAQDNETSLSLHLAYLMKLRNTDKIYKHVHRLDKETSGVILVAKNPQSLRNLNSLFKERKIIKKYLCLCSGSFENNSGRIELFLKRGPEGSREKVIVCREDDKDGKRTISNYEVISRYTLNYIDLTLVSIEIETGFMHQIRVHMKHLSHPIVGDKNYGLSFVNEITGLDRHFLHASSLEFEYNGEKYFIEAKLPLELSNLLEKLSKFDS